MDLTRSGRRAVRLVSLFAVVILPGVVAQWIDKRPLIPNDYDGWSSMRGTVDSTAGHWLAYTLAPAEGDGVLEVRQTTHESEKWQYLPSSVLEASATGAGSGSGGRR